MKLKYYLRGLGLGVLVTSLILGISYHIRGGPMSDREVIERARELGMELESPPDTETKLPLSAVDGEDTQATAKTVAQARAEEEGTDQEGIDQEGTDQKPDSESEDGDPAREPGSESADEDKTPEQESGAIADPDSITRFDDSVDDALTGDEDITDRAIQSWRKHADADTAVQENDSDTGTAPDTDSGQKSDDTTTSSGKTDKNKAAQSDTEAVSASAQAADASVPENFIGPVRPKGTTVDSNGNYIIVVESGMVCRDVAEQMAAVGLVGDAEDFRLYMDKKGLDHKIMAGTFSIPPNASYAQIAKILTM